MVESAASITPQAVAKVLPARSGAIEVFFSGGKCSYTVTTSMKDDVEEAEVNWSGLLADM